MCVPGWSLTLPQKLRTDMSSSADLFRLVDSLDEFDSLLPPGDLDAGAARELDPSAANLTHAPAPSLPPHSFARQTHDPHFPGGTHTCVCRVCVCVCVVCVCLLACMYGIRACVLL
jgi:hypothetical protein